MAESPKKERTFWYTVARGFACVLFHTLCPVRTLRPERLQREAPFLLISNHLSWMDPLAAGRYITRYETVFLGKKELVKTNLAYWLLTRLHMIIVDRHASDMEAMRACLRTLKEGHVLGIFPEGTRHHQGIMEEIESGTSLIALRSGVPVIPVLISGKIRPFHKVYVLCGEPIPTEDLRAQGVNSASAEALTERIRETYRRMLQELPAAAKAN